MKSSKSTTLMALAVASTFACAGAFAGGGYHSERMSSQSSIEVQTPSSVSESAPWLTNQWTASSHHASTTSGFQEGQFSDGPVGTSSGTSAMGSGGYSSLSMSPSYDLSMSDMQTIDNGDSFTFVEYWLLGDEPSGTGVSSSSGGAGGGGFDSTHMSPDITSMNDSGISYSSSPQAWGDPLAFVSSSSAEDIARNIGEASPLVTEHYLVYGPLASFDGQSVIMLELGPSSEDVALLDSLSNDFYVLTPVTDEG